MQKMLSKIRRLLLLLTVFVGLSSANFGSDLKCLGLETLNAWEAVSNLPTAIRTDTQILGRLATDLEDIPGLRAFINNNGEEGFKVWNQFDEVFPNRIFCVE